MLPLLPLTSHPLLFRNNIKSWIQSFSFSMSIDLQGASLRSSKRKCLPSLKIATFNCRTLKSNYRVLQLIELVRKQCVVDHAIQEHRRTTNTLATDINIPTGYRLSMNDTHSPCVGGIGFVISLQCSHKLIS